MIVSDSRRPTASLRDQPKVSSDFGVPAGYEACSVHGDHRIEGGIEDETGIALSCFQLLFRPFQFVYVGKDCTNAPHSGVKEGLV